MEFLPGTFNPNVLGSFTLRLRPIGGIKKKTQLYPTLTKFLALEWALKDRTPFSCNWGYLVGNSRFSFHLTHQRQGRKTQIAPREGGERASSRHQSWTQKGLSVAFLKYLLATNALGQ